MDGGDDGEDGAGGAVLVCDCSLGVSSSCPKCEHDEPIATTTPIAALEVRRRATTRANDDARDDAMRFERVV